VLSARLINYLDDVFAEVNSFFLLPSAVLHIEPSKQVASEDSQCGVKELEEDAQLVPHLCIRSWHGQNHLPNLHGTDHTQTKK
jgi:hypothetical protein